MSAPEFNRPGIGNDTLRAAEIRFVDSPEPGSIEIPYFDVKGKRTGFYRWRLPHERNNGQKYHQPKDSGTRAYIPPQFAALAPGEDLVIVEGEFKALSLIEAGIKAIGLPSFNSYEREDDEPRLLKGIAEAIAHTKPQRVLFLGDADTATNYDFARNAVFLASAIKPLTVVLPRIPLGGPGKGIDDCREALGQTFPEFWNSIVETAEKIDIKAGPGALAARLLEREAQPVKMSMGVERDKLTRRIVDAAVRCGKESLAKNRIATFSERFLGYSKSAFRDAVKEAQTARDHKSRKGTEQLTMRSEELQHVQGDTSGNGGELSTGKESLFPNPPAEPWCQSVNGTDLLNELMEVLGRYVVLPAHAAITLSLFILTTYVVDCFEVAPYVNLSSPEKRCGKTLLLRVLSLLCDRALPAANCSEASVFRALHSEHPCLLIDEVDTFFRDKPELRGILNAGNVRSEAAVLRCVEVRHGGVLSHEPRRYSVFGPKVFSGIGKLADTLADRSIVIPMRRKRSDESVIRFRRREFLPEPLRQKCRRWANDHSTALTKCHPQVPAELNDRAADLWEPLLAVAESVGGEWLQRARAASISLSGDAPERIPASIGERLLTDVFKIFLRSEAQSMTSSDLCDGLTEMDEAPWSEIRNGREINPNKLARLLKPFSIQSRKIRISATNTAQGYERKDFEDAWKRYTPSVLTASKWNSGTTPENIGPSATSAPEHPETLFPLENWISTNEDAPCSIVPVQKPDKATIEPDLAGADVL